MSQCCCSPFQSHWIVGRQLPVVLNGCMIEGLLTMPSLILNTAPGAPDVGLSQSSPLVPGPG